MKELKEFDIILENGRSSFCGGEVMRGCVSVNFEDPAEMRNIQVRFYGEGFSQVNHNKTSISDKKKKKKEIIVDLEKVLFGLQNDQTAESIPLHPHGGYRYEFSFMVPKYLPCSFESPKDREHGLAYIRYFLEATITRPWKKNCTKEISIRINEVIDTDLPEYSYRPGCQTQKELGICFPDGMLYIEAYLDDICYNQSSPIFISCRAENDSKRIMSSVYAKLFKRTRYRRRKETTTYLEVVAEYFGDRVLPKQTVHWHNLEFQIPATGPTITKSTRINVDYFLRVGMYQLFRDEIHVDLPVVIGTTKEFLMEKRRMEEELNQELSISVDRLPSDKCDFSETDKQKIRDIAEMCKNMPSVGSRPCVQFITAEERKRKRSRVTASIPRLEVLDESDDFYNSHEQPDLSMSTELLLCNDQGLLASGLISRRASETNLYVASKATRTEAKGGYFARPFTATPRQDEGSGGSLSRGNTPREEQMTRPSVRKAASHSNIDSRRVGEALDGKKIVSPRKLSAKQQTGRKLASEGKLDMKEAANIVAGLSNTRRKGGVKVKNADKPALKTKDIDSQKGQVAGLQGSSTERSEKKDESRAVSNESGSKSARSQQNASTKRSEERSKNIEGAEGSESIGGLSMKQEKVDHDTEMSNNQDTQSRNEAKLMHSEEEQITKSNGKDVESSNRGLRKSSKGEVKQSVNAENKGGDNKETKQLANQRKTSSTGQRKMSGVNDGLSEEEALAKAAARSQSILRSKIKIKAVNAFAKGMPKATIGKKQAANSTSVNAISDAMGAMSEIEEKSTKGRKGSTASRKSSTQSERESIKKISTGTNASISKKTSSVSSVGKGASASAKNDIQNIETEKEDQDVKEQRNQIEGQMKGGYDQYEQNNQDKVNNNVPDRTVVHEEVVADVNEMNVEAVPDTELEKSFYADDQELNQKQRNDMNMQRKSSLVIEENEIVPSYEKSNVESSPFSFEDLERDNLTEGRQSLGRRENALIGPLNQESLNNMDETSNLQRAPSLDEFELFESQLESRVVSMGTDVETSDKRKQMNATNEQIAEVTETANKQMLEHIGNVEGVGNGISGAKHIDAINGEEYTKKESRNTSISSAKTRVTDDTGIKRNYESTAVSTMNQKKQRPSRVEAEGKSLELDDRKSTKHRISKNGLNGNGDKELAATMSNGYDIEVMNESDIVVNSANDSLTAETGNVFGEINMQVDMNKMDARLNAGEASEKQDDGQFNDGNDTDENKNELNKNLPKGQAEWRRITTKIKALPKSDDARRRSTVNIRVLEEDGQN